MKSFLIDTNAILRFLLNDVPSQYHLVKAKISEAKKGKLILVVPEIIIFESYFALTSYYHYSKEKVLETLGSLIASAYFDIENRSILLRSLKVYKSTSLSLVDSYLAARSEIDIVEVFTFDKKLEKYVKNI
jgi:predicted nucleic-acid-binding protein